MAFYYLNHDSFGKTTNRAGAAGDNVRYNGDLSKTQLNEFLSTNEQYLAEHGVHRPDAEIEAHLAQLRQGRSPIGNAAYGTEHELTRSAAANAAYNARDEATYAVRSHVIPSDPQEAQAWFLEQEKGERKNARMSDRFIGAMPRSLSPEQCLDVAEDFCRTVTQNRVPWHFALHLELDKRNDPDWNPHAHIIFRDRDIETGKRFLYTTAGAKERKELDAKGIEWWDTTKLREAWADALNRGFERYHINDHADHRSYKKQGIDKTPGIHLGPKANAVKRKGLAPESKDFTKGKRRILYTGLDNGSRADHNERLRQASQEPKRDIHPQLRLLLDKQGEARRAMYQEQKLDRQALRKAHDRQIDDHKKWAKKLYANAAIRQNALAETKRIMDPKWKAARKIGNLKERNEAMAALKLDQKVFYANTNSRLAAEVRMKKNAAFQQMRKHQTGDRDGLRQQHTLEYHTLNRQHLAERLAFQEQLTRLHTMAGVNRGNMSKHQAIAANLVRQTHPYGLPPTISLAQLIQGLYRVAHHESDSLKDMRVKLAAQRQSNLFQTRPHERHPSQAANAMEHIARVAETDRRSQAQQAVASGRPLTGDERANAPEDMKQNAGWQDKRAAARAAFIPAKRNDQERGKSRGGGGRGR